MVSMLLTWFPYLWQGHYAFGNVIMPFAWFLCPWYGLHAIGMVSVPCFCMERERYRLTYIETDRQTDREREKQRDREIYALIYR